MGTIEFTRNYNKHYEKLFAFAYKLTKDENKAKDLMQETAYKAYKNLERFKDGTNFKAWTSTILRNTFINDYRRAKKRNLNSKPIEDTIYKIDRKFHTTNEGISNIGSQEIKHAITTLKDKYRIPFLLFYNGYEYSEIADKMGIPLGTVKSRLFVARRQLKSALSNMNTAYAILN